MTDTQPCPIMCVTGTGTGVGKTVVAAAIAAALHARGQRVAVVKPVQTGTTGDRPGDVDEVRRLAGPEIATFELMRLPEPLAPEVAARRAGVRLQPGADLVASIGGLARSGRYDVVLVEGSGGLLARLDADGGTLADVAGALAAGQLRVGFVVVVAETADMLNDTSLTLEALGHRGLELIGVIIGSASADPGPAGAATVDELTALSGGTLAGAVPSGSAQLAPPDFRTRAQEWVRL